MQKFEIGGASPSPRKIFNILCKIMHFCAKFSLDSRCIQSIGGATTLFLSPPLLNPPLVIDSVKVATDD